MPEEKQYKGKERFKGYNSGDKAVRGSVDATYDGLDDNLKSFVHKLSEKFGEGEIVFTSGYRGENEKSEHFHGNAVDMRPNPKVWNYLVNEEEGINLMVEHGLNMLDESDPKKLEGNAPHFHVSTRKYSNAVHSTDRYEKTGTDKFEVLRPFVEVYAEHTGTVYDYSQPVAYDPEKMKYVSENVYKDNYSSTSTGAISTTHYEGDGHDHGQADNINETNERLLKELEILRKERESSEAEAELEAEEQEYLKAQQAELDRRNQMVQREQQMISERGQARPVGQIAPQPQQTQPHPAQAFSGQISSPEFIYSLDSSLPPTSDFSDGGVKGGPPPRKMKPNYQPKPVGYYNTIRQPEVSESTGVSNPDPMDEEGYQLALKGIKEKGDLIKAVKKANPKATHQQAVKNAELIQQSASREQETARELTPEEKAQRYEIRRVGDISGAGDYWQRAKDIIWNPIDAFSYAMDDRAEMPLGLTEYKKLQRKGVIPQDRVSSNAMMNTASMASYAIPGIGLIAEGKDLHEGGSAFLEDPSLANAGWLGLSAAGAKATWADQVGSLSNAYKLNPRAAKEVQEQMLVRARPVGQDPYVNMAAGLRAKEAAGEPLKWYQKSMLNPTDPSIIAREKYFGRWFADNPSDLDFYINPGTRNFADDAQIEILKARMPKSEASKYSVKNFEDAKKLSNLHENEFILPKDMVQQLERHSVDDLSKLIKEYDKINKPHWWKGYGKTTPSKGETKEYKTGGTKKARYRFK